MEMHQTLFHAAALHVVVGHQGSPSSVLDVDMWHRGWWRLAELHTRVGREENRSSGASTLFPLVWHVHGFSIYFLTELHMPLWPMLIFFCLSWCLFFIYNLTGG